MLSRRVQILMDEERYARVSAEARARKVSFAEVIREAVDMALPPRWPERSTAGEAILSAAPMEVPTSVADLKAELHELRDPLG